MSGPHFPYQGFKLDKIELSVSDLSSISASMTTEELTKRNIQWRQHRNEHMQEKPTDFKFPKSKKEILELKRGLQKDREEQLAKGSFAE